ncbi:unnamed protein product, partial [Brassica rapa]
CVIFLEQYTLKSRVEPIFCVSRKAMRIQVNIVE